MTEEEEALTNSSQQQQQQQASASLEACDSLLTNITRQQSTLEEQSMQLDNLLKSIENHEIATLLMNQKNENLKVSLNNLELLNCLNATKLEDLERHTNEMNLLREIELNEFLCAQRNFYERKISEISLNTDHKLNELIELKQQLDMLDKLPDKSPEDTDSIKIEILRELEEALKQYELNTARLDYLQVVKTRISFEGIKINFFESNF